MDRSQSVYTLLILADVALYLFHDWKIYILFMALIDLLYPVYWNLQTIWLLLLLVEIHIIQSCTTRVFD